MAKSVQRQSATHHETEKRRMGKRKRGMMKKGHQMSGMTRVKS